MELAPKTPQIPPQVQQMTAVFEATVPYLLPAPYLESAGTLRVQLTALAVANLEFATLGLACIHCTMSGFYSYTYVATTPKNDPR